MGRGGLESTRASDRAEARLRVQALGTRVTVQLATLRDSARRKALVRTLDVLHTMSDLRLGEVLLLAGHEILLLLLPTLECILLVGSQSGAKRREARRERRLGTAGRRCRSRWRGRSPRTRRRCGGLTMRNADLRDQERLSGVSYPTDELCQWFVICVFGLLNQQLRREETGLVPVMHFESRPRSLSLSLRVAVDPPHSIRHDHGALLGRRRLVGS